MCDYRFAMERNDDAVDDPEMVASMVNMWVYILSSHCWLIYKYTSFWNILLVELHNFLV